MMLQQPIVAAPEIPQGPVEVVIWRDVDGLWPELAEGIARSCAKSGGEVSPADLWIWCRSGQAWLLVAKDQDGRVWGASVVKFETWSTGVRLRGLALTGTAMRHWLHDMVAAIRRLGLDGGAVAFVDRGEPGLLKSLQKLGQPTRILGVVYEVSL